jgi:hypothetical protein
LIRAGDFNKLSTLLIGRAIAYDTLLQTLANQMLGAEEQLLTMIIKDISHFKDKFISLCRLNESGLCHEQET